jgi:hypothetical protein
MERLREMMWPRHLDALSEAMRRASGGVAADVAASLRTRLAGVFESYAAWLERNWAEVYADPDHPPPVMFLIASLPMAVGLPLLRAVKTDDEPLLARLETALSDGPLLDQLQAAVQGTSELDAIAKRNLVRALEWVRHGHYVDAAAPLCHGLERAFTGVARRRGIIDNRNHFRVPARTRKATRSTTCSSTSPSTRRISASCAHGCSASSATRRDTATCLTSRRIAAGSCAQSRPSWAGSSTAPAMRRRWTSWWSASSCRRRRTRPAAPPASRSEGPVAAARSSAPDCRRLPDFRVTIARPMEVFQFSLSAWTVSRNASTRSVSNAAAAASYAGSEESAKRCSSPG